MASPHVGGPLDAEGPSTLPDTRVQERKRRAVAVYVAMLVVGVQGGVNGSEGRNVVKGVR